MKQLIKVTQQCIENGEPNSADYCPVALAIREQTDYDYVEVYGKIGEVGDVYYDECNVSFPRSVERFVKRFDNNKPVKPFNFFLEY